MSYISCTVVPQHTAEMEDKSARALPGNEKSHTVVEKLNMFRFESFSVNNTKHDTGWLDVNDDTDPKHAHSAANWAGRQVQLPKYCTCFSE